MAFNETVHNTVRPKNALIKLLCRFHLIISSNSWKNYVYVLKWPPYHNSIIALIIKPWRLIRVVNTTQWSHTLLRVITLMAKTISPVNKALWGFRHGSWISKIDLCCPVGIELITHNCLENFRLRWCWTVFLMTAACKIRSSLLNVSSKATWSCKDFEKKVYFSLLFS